MIAPVPEASNGFDRLGRYVLPDFDRWPPFSSFLPGIAGPLGVPMWAFYVNRGQAITSFGIESKDHPLAEFQPANKAYQQTPFLGFRTFLKLHGHAGSPFYEPFAPWAEGRPQRTMHIGLNELALVEHNPQVGLETRVEYFILPGESVAALVRQLTLRNLGDRPFDLELLDGLPALVPYGADNGGLKHFSRTLEAWMQVEGHEEKLPFYRLRASAADTAEISTIVAGHFAFAWLEQEGRVQHLPVLVDPDLVFGHDTSLLRPVGFLTHALDRLLAAAQIAAGKTPSALFGSAVTLPPGHSLTLTALFGHTGSRAGLAARAQRLRDPALIARKQEEARALAVQLTDAIATCTAEPHFDGYCRQSFLDNVLRGGWPEPLGDPEHSHIYHIYSRKHGDLERDYNDFFLAAEYYSQGNGNFRDVAQNRRNDVWFRPAVGDFNVRHLLSLIQADGYNPLVLQGVRFVLSSQARAELLAHSPEPERLAPLLAAPFTPGGLLKALEEQTIPLDLPPADFLALALRHANDRIEAGFGEGYWIDHWTYLLDLIESFADIFPDRLPALLFETELPYFVSPAVVQPRSEKYVLTEDGPRQYHAVRHVQPPPEPWLRSGHGKGPIFRSRVIEKLFLLALLKFATRDPWGMGVEMEAGKPGWYDALNGLPGLFGSSLPESHELLRLLRFLQSTLSAHNVVLRLPVEAEALLQDVLAALNEHPRADFRRWDAFASARERYRSSTQAGVIGDTTTLAGDELMVLLGQMIDDVAVGIARANAFADELPPTYFAWEMTRFEVQKESSGRVRRDAQGRPLLRALEFRPRPLPPFLEGPTRALINLPPDEARRLHRRMLSGPLWDATLGMFKVNASLAGEPHDIGRARAFIPGWLENESIWLHMHYKYLLELLKQGLYAEFFAIAR
ncbi:MAG: cellobiose phosphorylase, partial [Caldilineae bacterium]